MEGQAVNLSPMTRFGSLTRRQAVVNDMRLVLKADDRAPAKARDRMSKLRPKLEPRYDDVVLVVSELVTNSVRHSFSTKPIKMQMKVSDSRIRLEVSDWGTGFDAMTSLRSGGLGLLIVDRIAASWGVETNGVCTVWVEISKVPELATGSNTSRSQSPVSLRRPGG